MRRTWPRREHETSWAACGSHGDAGQQADIKKRLIITTVYRLASSIVRGSISARTSWINYFTASAVKTMMRSHGAESYGLLDGYRHNFQQHDVLRPLERRLKNSLSAEPSERNDALLQQLPDAARGRQPEKRLSNIFPHWDWPTGGGDGCKS